MVTGGSYGGHMTLAVATYFPARIRSAGDIVGISDFVAFLENTEEYRRGPAGGGGLGGRACRSIR